MRCATATSQGDGHLSTATFTFSLSTAAPRSLPRLSLLSFPPSPPHRWDIEWLEFALLNCFGSYPTPDAVNFFTNPTPPPGNVALTVTQTCKK